MAHTYLHGKPVEGVIEVHEHISPAANYVKVPLSIENSLGLRGR